MKKILTLITFLGFHSIYAQERTVASGGENSSSSGSVSYSIGLIDYQQISGTGYSNAGLQQPFELFSLGIEEWDKTILMNVYPNPTQELVYIRFEESVPESMSFVLTDGTGKKVQTDILSNKENSISLSTLAPASYFLTINQSNRAVRSYSIIKN